MELIWKIESIYIGKDISKTYEYNTICDPRELINKRYYATLSRYPLPIRDITEPYELSMETYLRLFQSIRVSPQIVGMDLDFESQHNDRDLARLVFYSNRNTVHVFTPSLVSDLLYEGYITPLGLLSFRLRRTYGNSRFRDYIKTNFLDKYFNEIDSSTYLLNKDELAKFNLDYFDLVTTAESYSQYPIDLQDDLFLSNPYIFRWRD